MCEKTSDDTKQLQYWPIIKWLVIPITIIFGIIIFLVWAILQPHKPIFVLQDSAVTSFSLSPSNLLTTNFQLTVSTTNPNGMIGIYYDKLDVYASYRNQRVTMTTELPSSYMGHKDVTIWSPFLYGNSVAVDPYLAAALNEDLNAGAVLVNIKIDGILKWKVGSSSSGKYRINVNCPAYLTFDVGNGATKKYQFWQDCSVDVAVS